MTMSKIPERSHGFAILTIALLAATGLSGAPYITKSAGAQDPAFTGPTVTTTTLVQTRELPNAVPIDFATLDHNNDGIITADEIGETLFYIFDRDGNEVIDNIEYNTPSVLTVIPTEQITTVRYDLDGDGIANVIEYSYETFLRESQLARFDQTGDGLTPREFIGLDFRTLDRNNSGVIELNEWREAYTVSLRPEVARQERYND